MLGLKTIDGFRVFPTGYRVSMWLVRIVSLLIIAYMLVVMVVFARNDCFYLANDNDFSVNNPLYGSEMACLTGGISSLEYLPPGFEAGFDAPFFVSDAPFVALFLLGLAGVLNHYLFNRFRSVRRSYASRYEYE